MRFGIIGCGAIARQCHGPALRNVPGSTIVGAFDRDAAAATAFAGEHGCEALPLETLLEHCDIAVIATPPDTHAPLVESALNAGRSVFVEKPFVIHHSDAVRLTAMARTRGLGLYVGHLRRFRSGVTLVRRLVDLGVIGSLVRAEAFEGSRFGWGTASGYVRQDPHGGVLYDTGSHTLDLVLHASGWETTESESESEVEVKVASVIRDKTEPSHEVEARFELSANRGTLGVQLKLSRYRPLANLVRLIGEKGRLEFEVGFQESVMLTTPAGSVRLLPDAGPTPFEHCFAAQYRSLLEEGPASRLNADRFVTLTRVLEALHGHGGR
ncbi:MAG: Gfo/Idh/MocA family oxidoreductase [Verrucomicrobiales bacterium]|nr:Gfo/Idh/MocA family oxidoreductase [Verrucomicrobiales bacterium]